MTFKEGEYEPYVPAYNVEYDPKVSYTIGSRDIGLLFGKRLRPGMLWKLQSFVNDDLSLVDDTGTEYLLAKIPDLKEASFTFDHLGFPIVGVSVGNGIDIYLFRNYGGDELFKKHIINIPGARNPRMFPFNPSDVGSVMNQPTLVYVDSNGDVIRRDGWDDFAQVKGAVLSGLTPTDILTEAGITLSGKIQLTISKIKTSA